MTEFEWLLVALYAGTALFAAGHALLTRTDPRAAWGWIAVCWLFPLAGPLLYYLLGANRIQRRARAFVKLPRTRNAPPTMPGLPELPQLPGVHANELQELMRIGWAMSNRPLQPGNRVEPLFNGEQAYPAMLEAIRHARVSVGLASYLFENHGAAAEFIDALAQARERGVDVRVVLDGFGDLYYWPRASRLLRARGVSVGIFLPPRLFPPMLHFNLRNHRKLLVVDNAVAFVGGMNIGDHHVVRRWRSEGIADVQFRVTGPVVSALTGVFEEDWSVAAGAAAVTPDPTPVATGAGDAACRVLTDGPDHPVDRLVMVLLGALANAHHTVRIMTPYFLPPAELSGALCAAALRGVDVRILIPQRSNEYWVDWATARGLPPLLQNDVHLRLRPAPFAHTKLFIVDDYYVQLGSANLDPRSLRLNFELMLEVYDRPLAAELTQHFDAAWERSRRVTLADLEQRPFWKRLRDSFFWLMSAYF